MKSQLKRNRHVMLVVSGCRVAMAAGIPSITELWASHGLTTGDFYLLEILFALALLTLEVVTGRFADRFGITLTLRIGLLASLFGSAGYVIAHSFEGFLLAEMLIALGLALTSGTDEACMYQSNKALHESAAHQKWWLANTMVMFASMAVNSILGGMLTAYGRTAPFVFVSVVVLLGFLFSLLLVEPPIERSDTGEARHLTRAMSAIILDCSLVRWMCVAPALIISLNQTFLWMYPGILKDCQLSMDQSGWIFGLFNVVAGCSAVYAWGKKGCDTSEVRAFFMLGILLACSNLGLLALKGSLLWLLILPQQVVRSLGGPLFSQRINERIPDDVRATALSIRNAIRVFVYVAVMIPWWLWIETLGRHGMFAVNLSVLGFGLLLLWVVLPRKIAL